VTSRDFCFWLQGYIELSAGQTQREANPTLSAEQYATIRRHLSLVFKHEIDPSMAPPKAQQDLNLLHNQLNHDKGVVRC
jgi:hypothetical protein